jgi:N-acetylmuramoyl-L-alanine amidase-like protein
MPFDINIIHWPTIAAFNAYLLGVPRPKWCQGLTNHNTYKPNELTWLGSASMWSMRATYVAKGWQSGPHLYLCAHAKNPAHTGIWQMTPINHPGTHAGPCNDDHLGIESVGDFDAHIPTAEQYTLLLTVNLLILRHWGLPPEKVNVHNECMPGRTCPGKFLTGTQIRADLRKPAPRPIPDPPRPYRVKGLPVYERSERNGPLWGHLKQDEVIEIDDMSNGHLKDQRGFIRLDPDTLEAV